MCASAYKFSGMILNMIEHITSTHTQRFVHMQHKSTNQHINERKWAIVSYLTQIVETTRCVERVSQLYGSSDCVHLDTAAAATQIYRSAAERILSISVIPIVRSELDLSLLLAIIK